MIRSNPDILQVFSQYLQYGGEEDVVGRISDALREEYRADDFQASSQDLIGSGLIDKLTLPLKAFHNHGVISELRETQLRNQYDFWLVHNVFPAISPSAYALAAELGVPIIHYLHNYRFGCCNASLFTQGQECRKCLSGNFTHGAIGKCWRGSYSQSTAMALLLTRTRHSLDIFSKVTRFIAISEAQRQIHIEMGVPAEKIDVVHHFLDVPAEQAAQPFPKEGHALFIGRLSPEKGVDRLLRAWAQLPIERKLVIAGSGPESENLKALAESLELSNVSFVGFLDRAAQQAVWKDTLFTIVPSTWQEPFGMVILEAWAQRRPVVAHRIGALPEIITDGVDGFLADPDDVSQLAEVLEKAFARTPELEEIGRNGFNRLKSYYNRKRWLEDIGNVFLKAAP